MRRLIPPFLFLTLGTAALAESYEETLAKQQPKFKWEVPPAPVLTGEAALKSIFVEDGFHLEMLASEPLVQEPVAMAFDPDGRLFVAEMRGYMQDMDGKGVADPIGNIVLLEDTDGDGKLDKRTVFVDGLVLPRALAFVNGGILVGEPPNLWFCRDTNGDGKADEKVNIAKDFGGKAGSNSEYNPNGLQWTLENCLYNAHWGFRLRYDGSQWQREPVPSRGQFGVGHDDTGRIYFNANSSMLNYDPLPVDYTTRNPGWGGTRKTSVSTGNVYPARITITNRSYQSNNADGKLRGVTSACSPWIYRGDAYPPSYRGNAFVCEPAGNLISRQVLSAQGPNVSGKSAHGQTDCIASTDERFRPVALADGPDGMLYIADMYHGIIQDKGPLTAYLRDQILQRGLDKPIHLGRIYRLVPNGMKPRPVPVLSKATPAELVAFLNHANGWTRDTAQRLLVERNDPSVIPLLCQLLTAKEPAGLGPLHALWTLRGMNKLNADMVSSALSASNGAVRAAAIRLAEHFLRDRTSGAALLELILPLGNDLDAQVQLQFLLTLTPNPDKRAQDAVFALLEKTAADPTMIDAAMTGVAGREWEFLQRALAGGKWKQAGKGQANFVSALAGSLVANRGVDIEKLLDLIASQPEQSWQQQVLLAGIRDAAKTSRNSVSAKRPVKLSKEPKALAALLANNFAGKNPSKENPLDLFTWPGKPGAEGVAVTPLTPEQEKRFAAGRELYTQHCAVCHQASGLGMDPIAPPLADSEWVLGPEHRAARIVMQGMRGKIVVSGKTYDLEMPPMGAAMTDEQVAAMLTYIRRDWGHTAPAVEPSAIGAIREAIKDHPAPWTADELKKL